MTPTIEQLKAIREVCLAIIETVKEAGPLGAPGGVLYAAMMQHGCTLEQFEGLMGGLVRTGRLEKRGHCYHVPASNRIKTNKADMATFE